MYDNSGYKCIPPIKNNSVDIKIIKFHYVSEVWVKMSDKNES